MKKIILAAISCLSISAFAGNVPGDVNFTNIGAAGTGAVQFRLVTPQGNYTFPTGALSPNSTGALSYGAIGVSGVTLKIQANNVYLNTGWQNVPQTFQYDNKYYYYLNCYNNNAGIACNMQQVAK